MTIPYVIRDQFGGDASKIFQILFDPIASKDTDGTMARNFAAAVIVAKAIGQIDGNLHDHELNERHISPHRANGEEHLPVSLYPANLRSRQFDLQKKLEPLIGEDRAIATAESVTEYAYRKLEESKRSMDGGD